MNATLAAAAPRLQRWAGPLLLALLTAAAAYASLRLSRFGGGVAGVWAVNGLLAGVLLLAPRDAWQRWLLASAAGQVLAGLLDRNPWTLNLGLMAANVLEAWIVAAWVRRSEGDLRAVGSLGTLANVALLSTLVACAASATLALPFLLPHVSTSASTAWATFYLAHVLGLVIVATLSVCLVQPNIRLLGRAGHRVDYFASIGLMLAACAVAFLQVSLPLLFLCYLPLLLLAYRHGLSGTLAGVIALASCSLVALSNDVGPFALMRVDDPLARLLFWQAYVACGCLIAYPTSVVVTERRRLLRLLRASERQYRSLADQLPAMVARFDLGQRYTYANERSRRALPEGLDPIGKTLREVRGDSIYQSLMPRVAAVLKGVPQNFEGRAWLGDRAFDYRTQLVPDLGEDGEVVGFYSMTFDISQAKEAERALASLARSDPLTGLVNRRHFDEELAQAMNRAGRAGAAVLVMSLDLDRFKEINDTHGHAVGDEVLREFARRLRGCVYDVDLVGRTGGDEFLVLVEHAASAETGARIALRVIEAVNAPFEIGPQALRISTSIGVGVQCPARSAEDVLALADAALYEAKARGRDTWAVLEA